MRPKGLKRMKVSMKRRKPQHRRDKVKAKPVKNLKTKLRGWRRGRHRGMKKVRVGRKKEGAKRHRAKTGRNKKKSMAKRKGRKQNRKRDRKKRAKRAK